jgi:hypothetical protein
MPATHLIAVPSQSADTTANQDHPEVAQTGAGRIRQLQDQARALAREEVSALAGDLSHLVLRAGEVAEGGEVYPPGVRELATRIAEELGMHEKVLRAIIDRASH